MAATTDALVAGAALRRALDLCKSASELTSGRMSIWVAAISPSLVPNAVVSGLPSASSTTKPAALILFGFNLELGRAKVAVNVVQ